MQIKSYKKFDRMPCAHAQYFDTTTGEIDFSGACAGLHGYSRSVEFEFSGDVDEHGWMVPFGDLKQVKKWLEFYFDHTSIIPADDPRVEQFKQAAEVEKMFTLRVLPYGVSMEMSALFIWEHVNAYIMDKTAGRCYVSKVTVTEHEPNSACMEATFYEAVGDFQEKHSQFSPYTNLPVVPYWPFVTPREKLSEIESVGARMAQKHARGE